MTQITIALAQMNIAFGEPRRNIDQAERLTAEAARRGAHIIVLPELWSTGFDLTRSREHAAQLNVGVFAQMATIATQNKICLTGSVLEKRGVEVANSAPFFLPNGKMVGVYRKLHLFRLMEEDRFLQPGSAPLLLDGLPWGATGIAICYDLRFPELFRRYGVGGAKLVIVPGEWPLERIEHWRALVVARAIENQCFMVAVNSAGETGGKVYGGHSLVVDPWGKILVELGEQPGLIDVTIDTDQADTVRNRIPVFNDRRTDIY